jgi:CubicO group peptidase (beta-lactamase class C family)
MDVELLDKQLTELAASDRFSGVVRIEAAGRVLFESAYGFASRAWRVPCSPRTRFDTASITKLLTAVATLQQIDSGAFALDTGVVDYLDLSATALSPAITPYHLLTHTSGIADDADEEDGERYEDLFVDRPNYSVIETADHLDQFVTKPPKFAPGEGCRYNNVAYILLGLMVERATKLSYREYVTTRVFAPAGMDRSGFFRWEIVETDVAEGADPIVDGDGRVTGWHRNIFSYPPVGSPDGGAYSTPEDLIRFHTALRTGALLSAASTAAMLAPKEQYRPRGAGMHYMGFGFEFETDVAGEVRSYWKEGINVGASGELCHYPAPDLTAAVLSNMENGAWEPIKTIDRLVTAATSP